MRVMIGQIGCESFLIVEVVTVDVEDGTVARPFIWSEVTIVTI